MNDFLKVWEFRVQEYVRKSIMTVKATAITVLKYGCETSAFQKAEEVIKTRSEPCEVGKREFSH